jgi:hypothetical protein
MPPSGDTIDKRNLLLFKQRFREVRMKRVPAGESDKDRQSIVSPDDGIICQNIYSASQ